MCVDMILPFIGKRPPRPRVRPDLLAQTLFWASFLSLVSNVGANEQNFGDLMPLQGGTTSTLSGHSTFPSWSLALIMTCLLLVSVYAFKQVMQGHRINLEPEPSDRQHQRHRTARTERNTTARATLQAIVPMTSLALLDSRLSSGARLILLIGGPALIIGLAPRLSSSLSSCPWWQMFLVSGHLLTFGVLWAILHTLFGVDFYQAQALLSWTCTGFVCLSRTLVEEHQHRPEETDHYMCEGAITAHHHPAILTNYFEVLQQQNAIMADIQQHRAQCVRPYARPAVREPPQVYRPQLRRNGPPLQQPNGRRLIHRDPGRNMIDDLLLGGMRFAAGRR